MVESAHSTKSPSILDFWSTSNKYLERHWPITDQKGRIAININCVSSIVGNPEAIGVEEYSPFYRPYPFLMYFIVWATAFGTLKSYIRILRHGRYRKNRHLSRWSEKFLWLAIRVYLWGSDTIALSLPEQSNRQRRRTWQQEEVKMSRFKLDVA